MPYRQVINGTRAFTATESQQLLNELQDLRDEIDDIRSKLTSLYAKLDADAGVADTNYASLLALAAAKFRAV